MSSGEKFLAFVIGAILGAIAFEVILENLIGYQRYFGDFVLLIPRVFLGGLLGGFSAILFGELTAKHAGKKFSWISVLLSGILVPILIGSVYALPKRYADYKSEYDIALNYDDNRQSMEFFKLSERDLSDLNLNYADFTWADLSRADLSGATLNAANLRSANLSGANLEGTELMSANLRYAVLSDAKMNGADLREANLSDTNLEGANLNGVDLSGAIYTVDTIWPSNFDASVAGAVLVDNHGNPIEGSE